MRDGGTESGQKEQTGEEAGTLAQSLIYSVSHSLSTKNAEAGAVCCQFMFQTLHATIWDGSSLEIVSHRG